jgi:DNA topoisomerase III
LYQRGILSYPRTETDQFDDQFDFGSFIQKQTTDSQWGAFATRLRGGEFNKPRKGKKNDKAHPPIHPTSYAGNLAGNEKKVYEYVTRRFLASCSKDAEGFQTTITVNVNNEEFSANGRPIIPHHIFQHKTDIFGCRTAGAGKELPRGVPVRQLDKSRTSKL